MGCNDDHFTPLKQTSETLITLISEYKSEIGTINDEIWRLIDEKRQLDKERSVLVKAKELIVTFD